MKKVALFLDRDGTLNINTHYTHLPEDLYWCNGVMRFFAAISNKPLINILQPIIVTNQSGVARKYYSKDECLAFEHHMRQELTYPLTYKHFYHSWTAKPTPWRKPNPGMLLQACKDHNLVPGYMIGDKKKDIEAGHKANCRRCFRVGQKLNLIDCLYHINADLRKWDYTRGYF
jgi:histidinol-phosphate phosphatase family protein